MIASELTNRAALPAMNSRVLVERAILPAAGTQSFRLDLASLMGGDSSVAHKIDVDIYETGESSDVNALRVAFTLIGHPAAAAHQWKKAVTSGTVSGADISADDFKVTLTGAGTNGLPAGTAPVTFNMIDQSTGGSYLVIISLFAA